jgi:hypothetical protein
LNARRTAVTGSFLALGASASASASAFPALSAFTALPSLATLSLAATEHLFQSFLELLLHSFLNGLLHGLADTSAASFCSPQGPLQIAHQNLPYF